MGMFGCCLDVSFTERQICAFVYPECSPSASINRLQGVCARDGINKSRSRCPPIGLSKHPMVDSYAQ